MQIKKSKYVFFYFRKFPKINLQSLLFEKDIKSTELETQIVAIPALFGQEVIISEKEFDFIVSLNEVEWQEYQGDFDISNLLKYGIIISNDKSNEEYITYRDREHILKTQKWNIYAVLFNFMTKWKDIDVELKTENANIISEKFITNMVKNYGPPPSHFHKVKSKDETKNIKLSKTIYESEFINVLLKRKTTRIFKKEKVPFEKFSSIIYYTFGAFGINRSYKEVSVLRKTSPSGGSLHPTEAYILVLNVERVDTGFYHYNVIDNSLIFIKGYSHDESKALAYKFTAGQEYTSESGFLVFLSTRYYRNYWKYMNHTATYQVTIRDATHLCQTFYLLGSLGLGVFTAAINHSNVEEELSLNPYEEGICMMVGCGIKEDENRISSLMPNFEKV